MNMITPPEHQGQMVETSYGWHDGCLYRRIVQPDGWTIWHVADEEESERLPEGWEAINGRPQIDQWFLCNHAPEEGYQL